MPERRTIPMIIQFLTHQRAKVYVALFAALIAIYSLVFYSLYPVLEGKPVTWYQALLFVIESVTTTGYGEMLPFDNPWSVAISILIMVSGIAMIFMILPLALTPQIRKIVEARPPRRTPYKLTDHVVIIGFGEMTRALIESLMISDLEIVVVEEERECAAEVYRNYRKKVYVVWGSYDDSRTWSAAWVGTAGTIVVCKDERTTAAVVLGIREMAGGRIISVVDDLSFDRYIRYAGAEYVLSPKNSTGKILARHAVLRPDVDTIYEATGPDRTGIGSTGPERSLKMIKIPIMEGSPAIGKSLRDLALFERYGIDILFFWKSGEFVFRPSPDDIIDSSTMLFVLGRGSAIAEVLDAEFKPAEGDTALAVIAGYGDVGKAAYRELSVSGIACVVVDPILQAVPTITGNAEDEEVLREARIDEARYCLVAVNDDHANIFTTLLARNINPSIRILARANKAASVERLYRAGADYVALLPTIGGQVIADIILSDIVRVLLDLPNGQKVVMKRTMKHVPTTVSMVESRSGVRILGLESEDRLVVRPSPDEPLYLGNILIVLGDNRAVKRFIRLV